MGVISVPALAGGGIKSVQRGSAGSAGDVTISSVNIAKSFVTVFGTASVGSAAGSGNINSNSSNMHHNGNGDFGPNNPAAPGNFSASLSSGTTNLVAAIVQGFLANSTTLTVSGACRYEVVEFA
jgi:hypothetical protein